MADLQLSWPIQKVQTVVFGADSVICADHRYVVGFRFSALVLISIIAHLNKQSTNKHSNA